MIGKVPVAALFKSNASLQLYDMLKASMYKGGFEMNYYEMLFTLGFANIGNEKISGKLIKEKRNVDWKELYDALPDNEKKYKEWTGFRRRVLDVAKKELEEKSDITFTYKKVRGTEFVSFQVYRNENYRTDKTISNVFNKRLIKEYAGRNGLSEEDINLLLEDADGDEELIKNAFSYVDSIDEV